MGIHSATSWLCLIWAKSVLPGSLNDAVGKRAITFRLPCSNGRAPDSKVFKLPVTKIFVKALLAVLLLAALAFAHGEEMDMGIGSQLDEVSPLHHVAEGHALSGGILLVLWASFFFALYTLFIRFGRKKK